MAGIKWIGSKHDNPTARGIPRASAVIVLNDPETHFPVAIMEGGEISGMRTAGVTVLASEYSRGRASRASRSSAAASSAGCTRSGCWSRSRRSSGPLYDQDRARGESARGGAGAARSRGPRGQVCETAEEAVCRGELVVPCTVTGEPYIELDWLMPGAFVSNISIMDVKPEVYLGVDKLLVDDWEQANRERKTINQLVLAGRLQESDLHAELGDVCAGASRAARAPTSGSCSTQWAWRSRTSPARGVYRTAREQGTGTW